ncbi:hypothetical protein AB205_0165010 [Aquarana catesbeiana]|uniref:G-protein coupled receptors family 1 profile domain-containing protein n=1 Tax=Aquarana catesbeiana TaxID=8400 RepID=A0A2G9P9H8_AQUCT|nr:hypothetical protein AB205_0165010 [Aquarana catesbeiana]
MDQCQNNTIQGFYIMGFTASGTATYLKFTGFLLMYVIALTGNMLIALLVCKAPQLHTPMYFFLSNLSIIDATYVSAILPKLLSLTLTDYREISFKGCITQLYFFVFCADAEICILICMAYDRYVAICSPLHYSMTMRKSVCAIMSGCSFVASRLKTFSSCTSHLINVILFYAPIIFLYIKPRPKDSKEEDPLVSLLYVAVVPTLNPFVYTLRNKEVIGVIVRITKIKSSR